MSRLIPGTTLKYSENIRNSAFSAISPVLEATGGLTLSQLTKLTGLQGSTVQNWIKRGWVASTKGKRYSQQQILRILLINMLRGTMKLENIVQLMEYINGDVEDTSDDIIDEIHLYNTLCRIIFTAEDEGAFDPQSVRRLIAREIESAGDNIRSGQQKLHEAMFTMVMAYRSSYLKSEMQRTLDVILRECEKQEGCAMCSQKNNT